MLIHKQNVIYTQTNTEICYKIRKIIEILYNRMEYATY